MPLTVQDILNVWNQIKVEKKKSCKLCPWLKAVKQQRLNESTWTNSRAAMLNVNASSWNILSCCATIVYKDANNGIAMFSHLLRSCSPGFNYGPLISPEVSSSQRDVSLIEKTHTNKYRSNAAFSAHTHTQTPTNTYTHIYIESHNWWAYPWLFIKDLDPTKGNSQKHLLFVFSFGPCCRSDTLRTERHTHRYHAKNRGRGSGETYVLCNDMVSSWRHSLWSQSTI